MQYSDYGKFGFTADGNSRIILRVRTDAPGSVTFSMPGNNLGIGIEALTNRADLNSGGSVAAYEIEDGVYQASAVLIAPETFPSGKNFPSDSFAVVVTFYGSDGSVKTGMIELKIEAAPVILIPGFSGSLTRSAVFSGLTANNFNKSHIYEYKYSQFKYFDETCAGLDKLLTNIFRSYAQYGLVCTKADIAAYGAGGLIAEKFLSDMQKDANSYTYNQPAVRRLVTIATPHYGTPYADIWLNSDLFLNILEGTTYGPIKLLLKTLISANREFVLKDDRLFPELATTAAHDYVFPKGVPVFCIYGDVSDELLTELVAELADRILQMKTDGKLMFNFKDIPGTAVAYALKYSPILLEKYAPRIASKLLQSLALKAVPFIGLVSLGKDIKDLVSLSIMLTSGLMFNSQKHDMYVSASSATGNFTASNVGFEGMEHEHFQIYKQPDIGNRTAALLKGSASVFSTPSRQAPPLNNYNKYKYSASKAEETFKFIEALKLSVEPAAFTLAEGRTQTVKVNVTANHETKYDIYCFIYDGTDGKIFIIPSSDNTGRNFYAEVNFDYNDLGNRNMFCFSCNPSDDTGESIYVSNVAQITAVADMTSIDAVSLDFNYGAELRAYVSADAPAGLYAIDKDGNYYDISSPLAGTEWIVEDPSIAYIDENGRVVGLKEGSTNLTAVYNGVSASVTVEVGEAYDTEAYQDEDNNNEDSENSNNEDNNEKDDEDGKGGDDAKLTTKRSGGGGGCSSVNFGMFALLSLSAFAVSARKRF
ncbi:MAG: Ig-like domain-containing protein [Synergistaceae bacterium]|nr:Ig-like domain-containing protein [Synergistaceae bacterium]